MSVKQLSKGLDLSNWINENEKSIFHRLQCMHIVFNLDVKKEWKYKLQTLRLNGDHNTSWKTHFIKCIFWEKKQKIVKLFYIY